LLGGVIVKTLAAPLEVKTLGDTGSFTGYVSVFNNLDLGGDVVEPGAFKDFELTKDGQLRVLYQHNARQPIGKARVSQDTRGLHLEGALVLDMPMARAAHAGMKAGILDGLSVGYDVLPGGSRLDEKGVRHLTDLKLWEGSIVTFPMNPAARVETVKTALDCEDVRDLEHLLREAPQFQFSSRKAKAAANALWPLIGDRDDRGDDREDREAEEAKLAAFADAFRSLNSLLTKGF
jgi:HK97 family phage prohead protease